MKKVIYTIILMGATNLLYAQGFFNKLKSKLASATTTSNAGSNAGSSAVNSQSTSDIKYTDPAGYGTVLFTYSAKEIQANAGSYDLWFASFKIVNNQPEARIADYVTAMYNYSNGQLTKTAEKPHQSQHNIIPNGSEKYLMSTDFSQSDQTHAILKNGPHVAVGMIPGKPNQAYIFNGKLVGNFAMAQIAHNADSTVVAVSGGTFGNSAVQYNLRSSTGAAIDLPKEAGAFALVSADGKLSAAVLSIKKQAYISNGTVQPINDAYNMEMWLRNSGNVFYVPVSTNSTVIERNGQPYYKFDAPIDLRMLFISADERSMSWIGARGLHFSDGTVFENASSPMKVMVNNKGVIYFLDVNLTSGNVYLCHHDL